MVSPHFLHHYADDHFDFRHILAYPCLIGRKGVSLSKVPRVISNSINTALCHSSLPDYCAEHDQFNDLGMGNW